MFRIRRPIAFLLAAVVVVVGCSPEATQPTNPELDPASAQAASQRYIVVLQDATVDARGTAEAIRRERALQLDYVYDRAIKGFAARLGPQDLAALRQDRRVKFIEADQVVHKTGTKSPTGSWGLDRIDMQNLPLDNSYTFATTGQGVTFYGIDTGIRGTHNEFTGRMLPGFTSITDGRGTDDCDGHGTHTASTTAGTTYGVAIDMMVVPVRVLNCFGSGTTSGVIAGVNWVTANAILPAVANMSLGGSVSAAMNAAVAASVQAGVVYAVSAGNSNTSACFQSPASEPSALTVGSTTITDARSSFSNFGTCMDLFAPGSNITAAWATSDAAINTISGTSMASPHVAGVAGLYLEANPSDTPTQVMQAILGNATPGLISNPGAGSPNLMLYMGFIGGGPPPTNLPPVADYTYSCDANITCTFDGTSSTDDFGVVSYAWTIPNGATVSTSSVFSHTFPASRTIDLTLTVVDAGGLSNSITQTVDASPPGPPTNLPPTSSFSWSCDAQRMCTFDGTGSSDDNGVVSYAWTIPNGATVSTSSVFSHTFPGPRTIDLTLTVADAGGLTDASTQTVVVP